MEKKVHPPIDTLAMTLLDCKALITKVVVKWTWLVQ